MNNLTTDSSLPLFKENGTGHGPDLSRLPTPIKIVSLVAMVIGTACIVTNILTLVIVYRRPVLRHKSRQLLISLAVADLLVGVAAFIVAGRLFFIACSGSDFVKWLSIAENIPIHVSVEHMLVIAGDRFLAIVFPLWYESKVTGGHIRVAIALLWLVTVAMVTVETLGFGRFASFIGCQYEDMKLKDFLIGAMVMFAVTFLLLTCMYCRIWCVARGHRRQIPGQASNESSAAVGPSKATKTITLILVTYMLTYLPLEIQASLFVLGVVDKSPYTVAHYVVVASFCLVLLKSCSNFFIYAVANEHFYKAYKSLFACGSEAEDHCRRYSQGNRQKD